MTIADRLERDGRIGAGQDTLERLLDKKFGLTAEERALIRSLRVPKSLDAAIDALLFAQSKGEVLAHLRVRKPKASRAETRTKPTGPVARTAGAETRRSKV